MLAETLRCQIINFWVEHGYPPSVQWIQEENRSTESEALATLRELEKINGVTVDNFNSVYSIVSVPPFCATPTLFSVKSARKKGPIYWATSALCALGIMLIAPEDSLEIHSRLGGELESVAVEVSVKTGKVKLVSSPKNVVVSCPQNALEILENANRISNSFLFFKSDKHYHEWCSRHNQPAGKVLDLDSSYKLAKMYFSKHHCSEWKPWTVSDIKTMLREIGVE